MSNRGTPLNPGIAGPFLAELVRAGALIAGDLPGGMLEYWSRNHTAELQILLLETLSRAPVVNEGYSNRVFNFTVDYGKPLPQLIASLYLNGMDPYFNQHDLEDHSQSGVVEFEGRLHGIAKGMPFPTSYEGGWHPSDYEQLLSFALMNKPQWPRIRLVMGRLVPNRGHGAIVSILRNDNGRYLQICNKENMPQEDYYVLEVRRVSPERTTPRLVSA